jgi:hypothetical protein
MISEHHRRNAVTAAFVALMLAVTPARGQQEGFRYAKPKDVTRVAQAAPVVKPPGPTDVLMTIEVNQEGSGYAKDENYVVGIDSVVVYTDRMRWTFFLKNKSDRTYATNVIGAKTYLADAEAETFRPLDMQYKTHGSEYRWIVVQGGCKERFWFDFPLPSKPTGKFKVGLAVDDFFLAGLPFKPFMVKLAEPIGEGVRPTVRKPYEADPRSEGTLKLEDIGGFSTERFGGMTRESSEPAPKPPSEAAQAVLSAPREGRRYEGSIRGFAGGEVSGGILFERQSKERRLSARIYRKSGPKHEIKLVGDIYEDIAAPGGLVFRFKDQEDVEYLFKIEGNNFSGTDTRGGRYSFLYKK